MKHYILLISIVLGISASIALAGPGDLDTTFNGTGKSRIGFRRGRDNANAIATQFDGIAGASQPRCRALITKSTGEGAGTFYREQFYRS